MAMETPAGVICQLWAMVRQSSGLPPEPRMPLHVASAAGVVSISLVESHCESKNVPSEKLWALATELSAEKANSGT